MTFSGAYGFRFPIESQLVVENAPEAWPGAEVGQEIDPAAEASWVFDEERASSPLVGGGALEITRSPLRATFRVAGPIDPDELVHPYLAGAAVFFARWCGYEVFHAGGVLLDSGVWAFLGDKRHGKSTLLSWLAARGVPVVADDLLVVDNGTVFAGPRCIDLRPDSFERLPHQLDAYLVRSGERQRVILDQIPPEAPLAGWIYLAWGDDLAWTELTTAQKMQDVAAFRGLKDAPTAPTTLLDLAALPAWRLARSPEWSETDRVVDALLDRLG